MEATTLDDTSLLLSRSDPSTLSTVLVLSFVDIVFFFLSKLLAVCVSVICYLLSNKPREAWNCDVFTMIYLIHRYLWLPPVEVQNNAE